MTGDTYKYVPERLRLLQEVHLVLHAAAGFELLHHHLGGVQACVHLTQQNLKQCRQRQIRTEKTHRRTDKPSDDGARVSVTQRQTCRRSGKTYRWTYPVTRWRGRMDMMSEQFEMEEENKETEGEKDNMLSGCKTPHGSACTGGLVLLLPAYKMCFTSGTSKARGSGPHYTL